MAIKHLIALCLLFAVSVHADAEADSDPYYGYYNGGGYFGHSGRFFSGYGQQQQQGGYSYGYKNKHPATQYQKPVPYKSYGYKLLNKPSAVEPAPVPVTNTAAIQPEPPVLPTKPVSPYEDENLLKDFNVVPAVPDDHIQSVQAQALVENNAIDDDFEPIFNEADIVSQIRSMAGLEDESPAGDVIAAAPVEVARPPVAPRQQDPLRSPAKIGPPRQPQIAARQPPVAPGQPPVPQVAPRQPPVPQVAPRQPPVAPRQPPVAPRQPPVPQVAPRQSPVPQVAPRQSPVPQVAPRQSPVPQVAPRQSPVPEVAPIVPPSPRVAPIPSPRVAPASPVAPREPPMDPRLSPELLRSASQVAPSLNEVRASQYHAQDEFGSFMYGYNHPNSAKKEQRDSFGNVMGSYTYRDATGYPKHVSYVADRFGFRVTAANNLPVVHHRP